MRPSSEKTSSTPRRSEFYSVAIGSNRGQKPSTARGCRGGGRQKCLGGKRRGKILNHFKILPRRGAAIWWARPPRNTGGPPRTSLLGVRPRPAPPPNHLRDCRDRRDTAEARKKFAQVKCACVSSDGVAPAYLGCTSAGVACRTITKVG